MTWAAPICENRKRGGCGRAHPLCPHGAAQEQHEGHHIALGPRPFRGPSHPGTRPVRGPSHPDPPPTPSPATRKPRPLAPAAGCRPLRVRAASSMRGGRRGGGRGAGAAGEAGGRDRHPRLRLRRSPPPPAHGRQLSERAGGSGGDPGPACRLRSTSHFSPPGRPPRAAARRRGARRAASASKTRSQAPG